MVLWKPAVFLSLQSMYATPITKITILKRMDCFNCPNYAFGKQFHNVFALTQCISMLGFISYSTAEKVRRMYFFIAPTTKYLHITIIHSEYKCRQFCWLYDITLYVTCLVQLGPNITNYITLFIPWGDTCERQCSKITSLRLTATYIVQYVLFISEFSLYTNIIIIIKKTFAFA